MYNHHYAETIIIIHIQK